MILVIKSLIKKKTDSKSEINQITLSLIFGIVTRYINLKIKID